MTRIMTSSASGWSWLSHIFILFNVALVAVASPMPLPYVAGHAKLMLEKKDVAAPPVTSPDASTVWTVGSTQTVTWDISSLPEQISNPIGRVLLGFIDHDDPDSGFNLMLDSPLAEGFPITAGQVSLTVPDVPARSSYIVALIGNSGNISPEFTITNSTSPELPPGSGPNSSAPVPPPESLTTDSVTITAEPTTHPLPPSPNPTDPGSSTTDTTPQSTVTIPVQMHPGSESTVTDTTTTQPTTTTTITGGGSGETTGTSETGTNTNAAVKFSASGAWTFAISVAILSLC